MMESYEDLKDRIEILEDDKRIFIEECNRLRKEKVRLKSAVVDKPLLCDGWRDMINHVPPKEGWYLVFFRMEFASGCTSGFCVDYYQRTEGFQLQKRYAKAWCELPDPPAFA